MDGGRKKEDKERRRMRKEDKERGRRRKEEEEGGRRRKKEEEEEEESVRSRHITIYDDYLLRRQTNRLIHYYKCILYPTIVILHSFIAG